jgi:hypothetical protein
VDTERIQIMQPDGVDEERIRIVESEEGDKEIFRIMELKKLIQREPGSERVIG